MFAQTPKEKFLGDSEFGICVSKFVVLSHETKFVQACLHADFLKSSVTLRPQAHRRFLWFFLLRLSCQKKEHLSTKHLKQRLQIFSHPRRHSTFLFEQRGTKRKVPKRKMPFLESFAVATATRLAQP
jgi:hypothetical protein